MAVLRAVSLGIAAATLRAGAVRVNDYVEVAHGEDRACPESDRISIGCGNCGPNWGGLEDCEDQCNAQSKCTYITYFEDHGCRVYSSCDVSEPCGERCLGSPRVGTQIWRRDDPAPVPVPPPTVRVNAGVATHEVNPLYMGCHSDTGYTHQARGFSSNLVFGESFEPGPLGATWPQTLLPDGGNASVELEKSIGLHGQTALHVTHGGGKGLAGLANRGIGNEGIYLQKGKTYDGFLFVKSAGPVTVHVAVADYTNTSPPPTPPPPPGNNYVKLSHGKACEGSHQIQLPCGSCGPNWGDVSQCEQACNEHSGCKFLTFFEDNGCRIYSACDSPEPYTHVGTDIYRRDDPVPVPPAPPVGLGKVLAEQKLSFAGGNWTRLNFTLTPSAGTECEGIEPNSDPNVNCGKMGPAAGHICIRCGGQFAVGLSSAGDVLVDFVWFQPGEWGRLAGLPVLKDTIDTLQSIGIKAIRQGGSFTDPAYYFWKNWRGVPWLRPSFGATWGNELISSWGPFEMLDMCEAAGFEPIIDTTAQNGGCCSAEDMADLVEYCWGDEKTQWGALRHADGHPAPYPLRYVELGNEQYNSLYVDQVKAMEERAQSVGKGGELYYIFPNNGNWMKDDLGDKAEALGMGDHLLEDFHVGGGGAVGGSEKLFAKNSKWHEGSLNLETNAGIHTMNRALMEATDLNEFFNQFIPSTSGDKTSRIKARTASFCTERSGHYDAFDQGITFFLPNMSWIQPPGYVHQMIHQSWLPDAVAVNTTGSISCSAQRAKDGSQLRLLVANKATESASFAVAVDGMATSPTVTVTTLAASSLDAANPPGQPALVSPVARQATLHPGGALTVPAQSFSVVLFRAA